MADTKGGIISRASYSKEFRSGEILADTQGWHYIEGHYIKGPLYTSTPEGCLHPLFLNCSYKSKCIYLHLIRIMSLFLYEMDMNPA